MGNELASFTRVTDMQVRHNFSARHNQLPAKPPFCHANQAHIFMAKLAICKLQDSIMAKSGPGRTCVGIALFFWQHVGGI
jgi:hypothetical protein